MRKNRVLLAEDDILVATDLALELESSGMSISAMTSSFASTLNAIDKKPLDFAVLNVELRDGNSYPAAKRLKSLGIPFVFFTGLERSEIDPEFLDIPRLAKPQPSKSVAEMVVKFLQT